MASTQMAPACEHLLQLYEDDAELVGAVAPYLAEGAEGGDALVVIATKAHRSALEAELEARGVDVEQARGEGLLFCLDAATTLAAFCDEGKLDHAAFDEVIGGLVRYVRESGRPVRAYGEMVALLWEAGDVPGAIELEDLWNELAREVAFSLFCSYPASTVSSPEHREQLEHVCRQHSSVIRPSAGDVLDSAEAKLAIQLEPTLDAPGRARRLATDTLRGMGAPEALVAEVALVVTELASNAVRHAQTPFHVSVHAHESSWRIAVADARRRASTEAGAQLIPRRMHGLGMIDALAMRWGVDDDADGKVVWAELAA